MWSIKIWRAEKVRPWIWSDPTYTTAKPTTVMSAERTARMGNEPFESEYSVLSETPPRGVRSIPFPRRSEDLTPIDDDSIGASGDFRDSPILMQKQHPHVAIRMIRIRGVITTGIRDLW